MAGKERGRLEMFAPSLEKRWSVKHSWAKNRGKTHLAQRISMRRNGLRQSRVNALDTMLAVRGSGSLLKKVSPAVEVKLRMTAV